MATSTTSRPFSKGSDPHLGRKHRLPLHRAFSFPFIVRHTPTKEQCELQQQRQQQQQQQHSRFLVYLPSTFPSPPRHCKLANNPKKTLTNVENNDMCGLLYFSRKLQRGFAPCIFSRTLRLHLRSGSVIEKRIRNRKA